MNITTGHNDNHSKDRNGTKKNDWATARLIHSSGDFESTMAKTFGLKGTIFMEQRLRKVLSLRAGTVRRLTWILRVSSERQLYMAHEAVFQAVWRLTPYPINPYSSFFFNGNISF